MSDLTPDQRVVIDHPADRILVDAGPGTGKTHTLLERILADQRRGIDPDDQIVVTYTVAAAMELKRRFHGNARPSFIGTLLSWCLQAIRSNTHLSGFTRDAIVIAEEDSREIMCEIALEKFGKAFAAKRTQECMDNRGSIQCATDPQIIAKLHRDRLYMADKLDFVTLVMAAKKVFEGLNMDRAVIYVDEFQDCSYVEAEMLLSIRCAKMIVIGDVDQWIFEFRDGRGPYHALAELPEDFEVLTLDINHRSPRVITDAANRILKKAEWPREERVNVPIREGGDIWHYTADSQLAAFQKCSLDIVSCHEGDDGSVCVISRLNSTIEAFAVAAEFKATTPSIWSPLQSRDRVIAASALSIMAGSIHPDEPWAKNLGMTTKAALIAIGSPKPTLVEMALTNRQRSLAEAALRRCDGDLEAAAEMLRTQPVDRNLHVGTIHSVKGMEFDHVIILGCNHDLWKDDSDENRRLFYVAITRARKSVTFVSWGRPCRYVEEVTK